MGHVIEFIISNLALNTADTIKQRTSLHRTAVLWMIHTFTEFGIHWKTEIILAFRPPIHKSNTYVELTKYISNCHKFTYIWKIFRRPVYKRKIKSIIFTKYNASNFLYWGETYGDGTDCVWEKKNCWWECVRLTESME